MANNIETAVTRWHRFAQQSANADTPASGYWNQFYKAGGLYAKNSAGGVFPLGGADATELTIATGAITVTQKYHKIDTEANAASDDLDTISGGVAGQELIIRADNTARTVVVKHGTGNIRSFSASDVTLDETYKSAHLIYDGTNWLIISGGGALDPNALPAWGSYADADLLFVAYDTGTASYQQITGDELRQKAVFPLTSGTGSYSVDSQSDMRVVFDDTTDRTLTINASTIVIGHEIWAQAIQTPGTQHKILLPSGVTWDGTNRAALITATTNRLKAYAYSTTRFVVDESTGVTFAAS